MPDLLLVGINYRIAPVEVRERLAFIPERVAPALQELAAHLPEAELGLLSTCNRTEFYAWTADAVDRLNLLCSYLAGHAGLDLNDLKQMATLKRGQDAAQHLLRVAAGLDSLVTGEDEILGQVKSAYAQAQSAGTCGCTLSALFRQAIQTGKRARAEAGIGQARQSVATVVVALARQIDPALADRTALLIGAGKISALTARALKQAGLHCILVANRTFERAQKLALALDGQAVHFDQLADSLAQADIVICSTGAPHTVLHAGVVRQAMAQRPERPLLIADLAVPRDVDCEVAAIPNVRLADIDDLEDLIPLCAPLTVETRQRVEAVVGEGLDDFLHWQQQRRPASLIQALQVKAGAVCQTQVDKTLRRLGDLTSGQQEAVRVMAQAIASQMLHAPIRHIKACPPAGLDPETYQALIEDLFDLDEKMSPN